MDKATAFQIGRLHPSRRQSALKALAKVEEADVNIRITQGLRTIDEQNAIWLSDRPGAKLTDHSIDPRWPGAHKTYAKGGESFHNYGLAIDFCLLIGGKEVSWSTKADLDHDGRADWLEVIDIFGVFGWASGLYWKKPDAPHLESAGGFTFQQLRTMMKDAAGYPIF